MSRGVTVPAEIDEIPGYTDLDPLGGNGFATTYRATPAGGGEPVAVKVLATEFSLVRKAFRRELAASKSVGHPNLLPVLDSGSTYAGRPYVVTRYCPGGPLPCAMPQPIADVLNLAVPVALALHAVHRNDLCHRGVKPSNVLLDADGQPVLAEPVTAALRADQPIAAGPVPLHTAPEILSGGPAGPRTDLYALAATVFHALTGRPPYPDRGSVAALLLSIRTDPPPSLTRADAPEPLRELMIRALAAEPDDRPPDALALAKEFHRILVDLGAPIRYPDGIWPEPQAAPEPPPKPEPARVEPPKPEPPKVAQETTPLPVPVPLPPVPPDLAPEPARRPRRAGVLIVAGVLAAVLAFAGFAVAQPRPGTRSISRAAPTTAPTTIPTIPPPVNVTALDDGSAVVLHWTLSPGAERANVVVQQAPKTAGQPPVALLNPGTNGYTVTGLNPGTGYCFVVGVLVSIGSPGQPGVVAWSAPACIRGAYASPHPE